MKKQLLFTGAMGSALLAVTGCQSVGEAAGMRKNVPDEFNVVTKAPLVVPPEYSLRPPSAGAALPRELNPARRGQTILFGQDLGKEASDGERALVASAGATAVDPNIRTQIDFEEAGVVRKNSRVSEEALGKTEQADTSIDTATGGEPIVIENRSNVRVRLPGT